MPLIDEDATAVDDLIGVRRSRSNAHENHACASTQSEVHPLLEARPLFLAHLEVGKDVAWRSHGRMMALRTTSSAAATP
jgi:hypothetical protein